MDLSGYTVTFQRNMLGLWLWKATTPTGTTLSGLGLTVTTEAAERDALRRISDHATGTETFDGEALRTRVGARSAGGRAALARRP
jgi:hypothetical protein